MSDVVSFTEIYSQHVELLPTRTLLQTSGGINHEDIDVIDDGGRDGSGGVDDPPSGGGAGGVGGVGLNLLSGSGVLGVGSDGSGGVDDDGPGGRVVDDGGRDGSGGVDDDGGR